MGLITTEVEIILHRTNIKHYENLGYLIPRKKNNIGKMSITRGTKIKVKTEDLLKASKVYVDIQCDDCGKLLNNIGWQTYTRCVKQDNKYYCNNCAKKLYSTENMKKTKLENTISFAQYGIDNFGDDFLEKYWDYEKNTINPWEISYAKNKPKVWIKCQNPDKSYHGSYDVTCSHFTTMNSRCPYCTNRNGKVHPLDSLGTLYPEVLNIWSDKNGKSPYEYSPMSMEEVWWKCPEDKHDDYKRSINASNHISHFRCPECQYSKGEAKINEYLARDNWIKITEDDYKKISKLNMINNKYYIPQKEFDGLIGVNNGNLSYDFYLPDYNLLIEYQGEFHEEGIVKNQTKEQFKYQQEHDRRKCEYARTNNINLLEIWYWDYNNIEKILDNILNK